MIIMNALWRLKLEKSHHDRAVIRVIHIGMDNPEPLYLHNTPIKNMANIRLSASPVFLSIEDARKRINEVMSAMLKELL